MIDLDTDPRLTAYVLDELGRAERDVFEQDMANADGDVDVAELISEIEELVKMLDEIYAGEPEYRMTQEQRASVLDGDQAPSDVVEIGDEVYADGKVLPWVVRATIGKKDKAAVAERLRPSTGRQVVRAIVGLGIAACVMGGLFWMVDSTLLNREIEEADMAMTVEKESPSLPGRTDEGWFQRKELAATTAPLQPDFQVESASSKRFAGRSITEQVTPTPITVSGVTNEDMLASSLQDASFGTGGLGFGNGVGGGGAGGAGGTTGEVRRGFGLGAHGGVRFENDGLDDFTALDDDESPGGQVSGEKYAQIHENQFKDVLEGKNQQSTFSIDVDTASYANVRRILRSGTKPPAAAVRIEEMVNYFKYVYPQPQQPHPFSVNLEVAACPWAKGHRLVRIGLKGREVKAAERPASNLVFLIDVSGSMQSSDKLPLLKSAMAGLVKNLREQDEVSIVVYAGNSGLVLEPTSGANPEQILSAIGRLEAGGSTNGGAGIELAYSTAKKNFIKGGVNRVILATDGDFNVGVTDQGDLVKMVKRRAQDDIFLTVLGFGAGNLKDELIEEISNRGNGNSFYIDTPREGHKVLVEEIGGTLETIAKDVKIQVEFNPAKVSTYRLIGYENRMLRNRDFNNDKIDAGEVGAGHTVTALYEIVPVGVDDGAVDELKYGVEKLARRQNDSPELLTVKLRYKQPEGDTSTKFEVPLVDQGKGWEASTGDFRFAAAVAGFGMLLRDSEFKGELSHALVKELAGEGMDHDPKGYRKEFLELVELSEKMDVAP